MVVPSRPELWTLCDVGSRGLFFFQAEDGIRDTSVTGVQTCALPISRSLSRNPEIKWRLRESDLARFADLQRKILEHALPHLKAGGKLVYSTCSLEREENEEIVAGLDRKSVV